MTQEIENWVSNLNVFGTDVAPEDIQWILDREHAAADPEFAETWVARIDKAERDRVPVSASSG